MKITGITEDDLRGKRSSRAMPLSARSPSGQPSARAEDKDGSQTARAEIAARTKELWEKKRSQLLHDLEQTADALEDEEVEAVLSPSKAGDIELASKAEELKERIEKMRRRQVAQLQRDAKRKLARSIAQEADQKKREELEVLLQDRAHQKNEKLTLNREKSAAQHAKAREKVVLGLKELVDKRRTIMKTLQKQGDHVSKMLEERFSGESEQQQEIQSRMAKIAEQTMTKEKTNYEKNLKRVEEYHVRQEEVQQRLMKQREDFGNRLTDRRKKFSGKLNEALDQQAQKEHLHEEQFLDKAAKLEAAKAAQDLRAKEVMDKIAEQRDKQLTRYVANVEKNRIERRTELKKWRSKTKEGQQKAVACREHYHEELVFSKSANRFMLQELVDANKVRLARAQDSSREQTLAKVERDRARTDAADELKRRIDSRRIDLIKESMDSRAKVEELNGLDPSAGETNTRRINEILTQLGLEPWSPPKKAKEEEDGQQK